MLTKSLLFLPEHSLASFVSAGARELLRNCKRIEIQREKANQARDTVGQDKKTEIENINQQQEMYALYAEPGNRIGKNPEEQRYITESYSAGRISPSCF